MGINERSKLESRLEPIVDKLGRGSTMSGNLRIIPPEDYDGVVDNFFPRRAIGSRYLLAIDGKHRRFEYWTSNVKVRSGHFKFNPIPSFNVEGELEDSGGINDFVYYIVKVSKVKTGH